MEKYIVIIPVFIISFFLPIRKYWLNSDIYLNAKALSEVKDILSDPQYTPEQIYDLAKEQDLKYFHAFWLLRAAAERGLDKAQLELGIRYYRGFGTAENDELCVEWIEKAAGQGNADIQTLAANFYNTSRKTTWMPDEKKENEWNQRAVYWYLRAAEKGNTWAQYRLGTIYSSGYRNIISIDMDEAEKWYQKAAEQGHDLSTIRWSAMQYAKGKNREKAEEILRQYAYQGSPSANRLALHELCLITKQRNEEQHKLYVQRKEQERKRMQEKEESKTMLTSPWAPFASSY